jgi:AhpD family alkylhydroperoxidase
MQVFDQSMGELTHPNFGANIMITLANNARRQSEREARSREAPILEDLPDLPGIICAMELAPGLKEHLGGLANLLLTDPFPGATVSRAERELLATAVSAENACFFCADSHSAVAAALMRRDGMVDPAVIANSVASGSAAALSSKMAALREIAVTVAADARRLRAEHATQALAAGASSGDVKLAILIASAFCMYNRMVDGLKAKTFADPKIYEGRASQLAEMGYRRG